MYRYLTIFSASLFVMTGTFGSAFADSIETQANPVSDGAITIEMGNPDRSDWSMIPWYEVDSDNFDLDVDPYRVQIAHDSTDVFVHIQLNEFDIEPGGEWRVQLWVDSDQDWETGYQTNWAIGPESLLEVSTIFDYVGVDPGEWAWSARAGDLPRDQTDPLDLAVQIPRESIGNPEAFDFLVTGQSPDGTTEDTLPDFANEVAGDFFTYELTGVGLQLQAGDANQDLQFDQLDLVMVQIAAKYLTGQAATWGEGDWNAAPGGAVGAPPVGDHLFDQLDIIAALAPAHYLTGPYAAVGSGGQANDDPISVVHNATAEIDLAYVPEPTSALLLVLGLVVGLVRIRPVARRR